jgi:hypothetical protein
MDSEADLSALSLSPILDLVESELSKRRLARTTWAHIRLARDGERACNRKAQIKYYTHYTESQPYGTSIFTNMRSHLRAKHQIFVEITLTLIQQATID